MRVHVDGVGSDGFYLLICSVCGPLGVSEGETTVPWVHQHLQWHGVTNPTSLA